MPISFDGASLFHCELLVEKRVFFSPRVVVVEMQRFAKDPIDHPHIKGVTVLSSGFTRHFPSVRHFPCWLGVAIFTNGTLLIINLHYPPVFQWQGPILWYIVL